MVLWEKIGMAYLNRLESYHMFSGLNASLGKLCNWNCVILEGEAALDQF